MDLLKYIKWYYVLILCLVLIIMFLIFFNKQSPPVLTENIKQENFNKDKNTAEIILYYATWCHHCKQLLPEWKKFEDYGINNLRHIKITKIQCEDGNENLCLQKGITGYPTVILYLNDGSEHKYEGGRTSEQLINFINKKIK